MAEFFPASLQLDSCLTAALGPCSIHKIDGDLLRAKIPEGKLLCTACCHDLKPPRREKCGFSCHLLTTGGSSFKRRYVFLVSAVTEAQDKPIWKDGLTPISTGRNNLTHFAH